MIVDMAQGLREWLEEQDPQYLGDGKVKYGLEIMFSPVSKPDPEDAVVIRRPNDEKSRYHFRLFAYMADDQDDEIPLSQCASSKVVVAGTEDRLRELVEKAYRYNSFLPTNEGSVWVTVMGTVNPPSQEDARAEYLGVEPIRTTPAHQEVF